VSEALAALLQAIGFKSEVDPGKMRSYVPARP
jgi:hypothetical protein